MGETSARAGGACKILTKELEAKRHKRETTTLRVLVRVPLWYILLIIYNVLYIIYHTRRYNLNSNSYVYILYYINII